MKKQSNAKVLAPRAEDYSSVLAGLPSPKNGNDLNKVCICTCVHCTIKILPRIKPIER